MNNQPQHSELAAIRSLMERSSKFLSLSGLSGVLAGIYALIGGWLACQKLNTGAEEVYSSIIPDIIKIALVVLVASLTTGVVLTVRQAKKNGEQVWNPVSKRLLIHMLIPLITGGLFILILLVKGQYTYIAANCLIFYGLSLIAAGAYSFPDIKFLGGLDIGLGLAAALFTEYGLIFWMIGFGGLHIVYGIWMHIKYNK